MAQKKEFRITTHRGSVFTSADANGSVTAKIEWAPGFAQRKAESFSKAQQFVDSECLRYMNPLKLKSLIAYKTFSTFQIPV